MSHAHYMYFARCQSDRTWTELAIWCQFLNQTCHHVNECLWWLGQDRADDLRGELCHSLVCYHHGCGCLLLPEQFHFRTDRAPSRGLGETERSTKQGNSTYFSAYSPSSFLLRPLRRSIFHSARIDCWLPIEWRTRRGTIVGSLVDIPQFLYWTESQLTSHNSQSQILVGEWIHFSEIVHKLHFNILNLIFAAHQGHRIPEVVWRNLIF